MPPFQGLLRFQGFARVIFLTLPALFVVDGARKTAFVPEGLSRRDDRVARAFSPWRECPSGACVPPGPWRAAPPQPRRVPRFALAGPSTLFQASRRDEERPGKGGSAHGVNPGLRPPGPSVRKTGGSRPPHGCDSHQMFKCWQICPVRIGPGSNTES